MTPFGLPDDMPVLVDARVMEPDWIILGGGNRVVEAAPGAGRAARAHRSAWFPGLAVIALTSPYTSCRARLPELRGVESGSVQRLRLLRDAALSSQAPPKEERKVLTVVFCDLKDSTVLGERLDPEALGEVLDLTSPR